jgi:tRNA(adenine34) deaminase
MKCTQAINDKKFMEIALEQAKIAFKNNQIPIGAIIVNNNGKVISKSTDYYLSLSKTISHAELLCINSIDKQLKNLTMYVTLEPCFMCAGAIKLSRISKLVFGAYNHRDGGVGTIYDVLRSPNNPYNSDIEVIGGVLEKQCALELQNYNF